MPWPPTRSWFSGSLSSVDAGGVVVGVHDEAVLRVDGLRQLARGQREIAGAVVLVRVRILEPLVATLPVTNEPGRRTIDGVRLQVFAQRNFAGREIADVAVDVAVDEILRTDVEVLQCGLEVLEVPARD